MYLSNTLCTHIWIKNIYNYKISSSPRYTPASFCTTSWMGVGLWKVAHALHRQKNVEATVRRNIQSRNPGTVTSRNEHSKRNIENIPQKTCNISKLVHHWWEICHWMPFKSLHIQQFDQVSKFCQYDFLWWLP